MPKKQLRKSFYLLIAVVLTLLLAGALLFHSIEGWSFLESFYFAVMTATTVGYGDYVPTHTTSQVLTIVYALSIIPIVLYAFAVIAKYYVDISTRKIFRIEKKQREHDAEIERTERKLTRQLRKLKEQEELNEAQEKRLEAQQRRLKQQEKENDQLEENLKRQNSALKKASKELDMVEDVVTDVYTESLDEKVEKNNTSKKAPAKKRTTKKSKKSKKKQSRGKIKGN